MSPQEQLNEAAENYGLQSLDNSEVSASHFIAGALSPEAANGCNKHVEKAKIEFAIEILKDLKEEYPLNKSIHPACHDKIKELQTKLNQLEQ